MRINCNKQEVSTLPLLSSDQKTSPFAQYYYVPITDPVSEVISVIAGRQMNPALALPFSEIERLFLPDSMPAKNGWCVLPDGTGFSVVCTNMPLVTPEMEKWWNAWFVDPAYDYLNYRIWMPGLHFSYGSPIVENLGWGLVGLKIEKLLFPNDLRLSRPPEKLDPKYIHIIACCGNCTPIDEPDTESICYLLIHCFKQSGKGIQIQTINYMGIKWENGVSIKVHDVDPDQLHLFALHSAYEYHRMSVLLPKLYTYAQTLPNHGLNPSALHPDLGQPFE